MLKEGFCGLKKYFLKGIFLNVFKSCFSTNHDHQQFFLTITISKASHEASLRSDTLKNRKGGKRRIFLHMLSS